MSVAPPRNFRAENHRSVGLSFNNSTRISYTGDWDTASTLHGLSFRRPKKHLNRASFQVEYNGTSYGIAGFDINSNGMKCKLDDIPHEGRECLDSTFIKEDRQPRQGNHVLNVTCAYECELHNFVYAPANATDGMILQEPGLEVVYLSLGDRNITLKEQGEMWNVSRALEDARMYPNRTDAFMSILFQGTGIRLLDNFHTSNWSSWDFTLDDRHQPLQPGSAHFTQLCYGTHNLTMRYSGNKTSAEQGFSAIFAVKQPSHFMLSDQSTICDVSTAVPEPAPFPPTSETPPLPTLSPSAPPSRKKEIVGSVAGALVGAACLMLVFALLRRRHLRRKAVAVPTPVAIPFIDRRLPARLPSQKYSSWSSAAYPAASLSSTSQPIQQHGLRLFLRQLSELSPSTKRQLPEPPETIQYDVGISSLVSTPYLARMASLPEDEDARSEGAMSGSAVRCIDSGYRTDSPSERPLRFKKVLPPLYTDS